ncbi:tyrosine-type recombinase/integrase [Nakamurella sp.]|uniref:tyrosine-type recombinase/integrase n=1 Tax=Nakamurella sp. TaxID=1869182 RepID=UPI003B3A9055
MTSRNPNRASSVYQGGDGFWHGRVTVGYRDDGSIDRRHVMGKTKGVVVQKVRDLERARDQGQVRRPGQRWTVAAWLDHWLENIARPNLRATSYSAYQVAVRRHLIPEIGKHRLDRLEPEHLERLYRKIVADGGRPGRAHQVHRTIRTALGEAHRRGHVARNVAALARPPRVQLDPVQPYTVDEVRAIMRTARGHPNGVRWAIALALGLRQGEVLGLTWSDVDLDAGFLRIRATRHRPTYGHGCGGACGKTAGRCPQRIQSNRAAGDTKSDAGRRTVGLPAALGDLLREHRDEQKSWQEAARQLWQDGDWVFTSRVGAPLNPSSDYHRWKALLREAGVRDGRLHDARHTAATVLLVLGVPERTVMGIMGWSSTAMAACYQHVTDPIRRQVANQVDGLLWSDDRTGPRGN